MRNTLMPAIESLYEAAISPQGASWTAALDSVAAAFSSVGAVAYPRDPALLTRSPPVSREIGEHLSAWVAGGWHLDDLRGKRGWAPLQRRTALIESDIIAPGERSTLRSYQEFYFPRGVPGWACSGFVVDGFQWSLSFLRSSRQGDFGRSDLPDLVALSPHLARVISFATATARSRCSSHLAWAERDGEGAIALDGTGAVVGFGAVAEHLLSDGFRVAGGRLRARHYACDAALQQLVRAACAAKPWEVPPPPVLLRDEENAQLLLRCLPIVGAARDFTGGAVIVLLVSDLARPRAASVEVLRSVFGLTQSEARVAAALAGGRSPAEIALDLGISRGTVHVHLRSIFLKTDTHRQSELVAMIARLPG